MGERGPSDPLLLPAQNISSWAEISEALGSIVDTNSMTITLIPMKSAKLRAMLAERPPSRNSATKRQISQVTGFLQHISFVGRPRNCHMQGLICVYWVPPSGGRGAAEKKGFSAKYGRCSGGPGVPPTSPGGFQKVGPPGALSKKGAAQCESLV